MSAQRDQKPEKFSDIPSKAKRQEAFLAMCKKERLSAREIVERASVFPIGVKSRVLNLSNF